MRKKDTFNYGFFKHGLRVCTAALVILFITATSWHCSGKSEEELLLDAVNLIGDYGEDRNLAGLLGCISPNYSDDKERTFADIRKLLEEYFGRYRGIVINMLGTRVVSLEGPKAQIITEVALSSGAAKIFRKAVRYSGRFYRFTMTMTKENDRWKCSHAVWESLTLQELFPESFEILEKLFPNIAN